MKIDKALKRLGEILNEGPDVAVIGLNGPNDASVRKFRRAHTKRTRILLLLLYFFILRVLLLSSISM